MVFGGVGMKLNEALDTAKIDNKMNEIVNYIVKEHIANERKR